MNQPILHFVCLFYSGKFRAVRDISVAPIDASDQAQIIRMMDEDDGVSAVRRAKKTFGSLSSNATSNLANALTGASSTFASGGGIIKQGVMMGAGSGKKKERAIRNFKAFVGNAWKYITHCCANSSSNIVF